MLTGFAYYADKAEALLAEEPPAEPDARAKYTLAAAIMAYVKLTEDEPTNVPLAAKVHTAAATLDPISDEDLLFDDCGFPSPPPSTAQMSGLEGTST